MKTLYKAVSFLLFLILIKFILERYTHKSSSTTNLFGGWFQKIKTCKDLRKEIDIKQKEIYINQKEIKKLNVKLKDEKCKNIDKIHTKKI